MSVDLEALKGEVDQLFKRVDRAELLQRTVQLYGIGYLLQRGTEQIALKPADVTIVLPADAPVTDFDLRARIEALEAELALVRAVAEASRPIVARMKQGVGDSWAAAYQWLDPTSLALWEALEAHDASKETEQ